jgi:hypothetical protein
MITPQRLIPMHKGTASAKHMEKVRVKKGGRHKGKHRK